jgi:lycopene beta-cyclase
MSAADSPPPLANRADLVIVGGGLAGGLIALALARWQPDLHVELVDGGAHFGGNHVWSFFASDVSGDGATLLEPLIAARWDGYDVAFPAHSRTLATGYASITSELLDAELRRVLGPRARSACPVAALSAESVTLADGSRIEAAAVIDARGAGPELAAYEGGWQKFVGQMLHLSAPHGLTRPIVMDATVDQIDGYRFVYVLPFGPTELFVEDTYYSDTPDLDRPVIAERIAAYAAAKGWQVAAVEREETGVLPVLTGGDFDRAWPVEDDVARAGARATMFHATTGYSLPQAVALALAIAHNPDPATLTARIRAMAADNWRRGGFYRLLDTMLFHAAVPDQRYRVLERFYRLSPGLIERFYAGKTGWRDRIRLLSGRPPVPITAAVRAILRGGSSDKK